MSAYRQLREENYTLLGISPYSASHWRRCTLYESIQYVCGLCHKRVAMFDFAGETSAAYHELTEKVVKVHLSSRPFSSTHTRQLIREWISLPVHQPLRTPTTRLRTAFYQARRLLLHLQKDHSFENGERSMFINCLHLTNCYRPLETKLEGNYPENKGVQNGVPLNVGFSKKCIWYRPRSIL